MIAKDDPDYVIEEYKGRIIASHKNNVSQKSMDNIIIVYDKLDFPDYGFYIGLDDSKSAGYRKMEPVNMDDARGYIDWLAEVTNKNDLQQDASVSVPIPIKEIVGQILSEVALRRLENNEAQFPRKSRKKGRGI
ncbi:MULTISPECIES: hypothetical protein [Chryseobacterium]|uniref:Uncharacterized protein n=2 Tax=Chryseobacterium gleum TaxID=250 RepID=A0A3S4PIC5_CHRGE|nr:MULTISPECIES: hypothetical protein [Chryseobacterium]EFK36116.1 hypothetical protein HMPREF0204_15185 [Chryseobacterium gleum ATCC 35910]QQY31814.1 hypothetical protein I6I60_23710 [Chryseobacterium gleum]VEE11101.1 Uncharacterised protein [Chryseobacterium gleum]VFA43958.1 Uncharacterised protein [Chryseobacterium indologenes]